jgi:hypothetical protein
VEDEVNGVDLLPTEDENRIMICQAIIKCADISNPVRLLRRPLPAGGPISLTARTCSQQTRPIDVSEHWSSVLLQEWAIQARLEQRLSLPVSVISSADAALQARGQIGFIDLFTAPLFEAATEAMPCEQRIKLPTQYSHTSLTYAHFYQRYNDSLLNVLQTAHYGKLVWKRRRWLARPRNLLQQRHSRSNRHR